VIGFPEEKITIVGIPVEIMLWTRKGIAPTRFRDEMSTCSPVVAFRPSQSSFWSRDWLRRLVGFWGLIVGSGGFAVFLRRREIFAGFSARKLERGTHPSSYYDNGDIGGFCGCDGVCKPGLVVRPSFASLTVGYFAGFSGSSHSVKRSNTPILALINDIISILVEVRNRIDVTFFQVSTYVHESMGHRSNHSHVC